MKKGTYHYRYFTGQTTYWRKPVFADCTLRVEVVEETKTSYRVKYLGLHANGAAVGSLHWVRKDKVRIDGEDAVQAPAARNIRLPYKD